MEIVYSVIDRLLPFAWADPIFMKNAFLAVLLLMPLFGLLGTMVVSNKMAFFSDSLGHGAFTGIAIGALAGNIEPRYALVAFSIVFALFITYIKNRSRASTDTIIGVFSSTAIAIGLVIMSHSGGFHKFSSYLIGDLLSITEAEIATLFVVCAIVFTLWASIFNRLFVSSLHPSLAASRGIHTMQLEMAFASALAVVVAISIQWVGLLIINSMLVLPAAAARNVTNNSREYHFFSVCFALLSGIGGLVGAYYVDTAAGASIVLVSAALFFLTLSLKNRMVR